MNYEVITWEEASIPLKPTNDHVSSGELYECVSEDATKIAANSSYLMKNKNQ